MDAVTIKVLPPDAGKVLRHLRLGALNESPNAFSPLAAEYMDRDDAWWAAAAARSAANREGQLFIAEDGSGAAGLVSAEKDANAVGHIGAMWVAPRLRGGGTGRRLLEAALDFLDRKGCRTVRLTVTETNTAAIALYRSAGFSLTGVSEPLRPGSPLANLEMQRDSGD